MHKLNVCGLSCPHPVLRVKEAIDAGKLPLQVIVDAGAPLENIKRMAENIGLNINEAPAGQGAYVLELTRT